MSTSSRLTAECISMELSIMRKSIARVLLLCATMMSLAILTQAQSLVLDLPFQSQQAEISQRIGLTDITIRYHRPLAKDRKIWTPSSKPSSRGNFAAFPKPLG
jgi:hypothetical protein